MIRLAMAALGASMLASPGAMSLTNAQPPLQPGEVNVRIIPSAATARDYPTEARKDKIEGEAVAVCAIDGGGALKACKIQQEAPADYGFGEALLETAERVRIEAVTRNGAPTAGRSFRLAMRFRLTEHDAAASAAD
jgi:TonB family protein